MDIAAILAQINLQTKRKVFVSYHHGGDQVYYDFFSKAFSETYDVIYDTSLERALDSDDVDYVNQSIRDQCISGSSCTIVLCGKETPWRKYVDWEIKATLDMEHGLIGVNLPTNPINPSGKYLVPDRLHDNIQSGYAVWDSWASIIPDVGNLKNLIEQAINRSGKFIINNRQMMARNGTPPWA
jgi:hypothetical protein